MNRVCKTCAIEKPLEDFPKSGKNRDGRRPQCKVCMNAYWRRVPEPKRRQSESYKARKRITQKQYRERHPEKAKAHLLARINKDKIKKDNCEHCGNTEKLHMHHPDYNKPLEVITLCVPCHEQIHHGVVA